MIKFIIFIFVFSTSFFAFSAEIKAISGIRYFPPTPYSNTAMNAYRSGALRGAVTVGNNFAIAKIKGDSILGLGKQLARSNPYTLAAMAALAYYQDDIGNWFFPPVIDGQEPTQSPDSLKGYQAKCSTAGGHIFFSGIGDAPTLDAIRDDCGPQLLTIADTTYKSVPNAVCDVCYTSPSYSDGSITILLYHPEFPNSIGSKNYPVSVSDVKDVFTKNCPPNDFPTFTVPISDSQGEIIDCKDPSNSELYDPKPVTLPEVADVYADDLMKYHNEGIESLQNWEPYLNESGNVEPQYIDSYNQPDVSTTMNEYMKNVSSGNYQTIDANAPNYVPLEMVQPTQTAINSTFNDLPFLDPTNSTIIEPNPQTDGAATPTPAPNGTATNPINVTGDITVNVEIPEDDTISQTEYEQSNRKFQQEETDLANTKTQELNTSIEQLKTQESDFIDNLGNYIQSFDVPALPTLASFFPSFNSGCVGFTLDVSVAGTVKNLNFDKHCPPWNSYVNPILTWFLYMMTSLYVLNLSGRTLTGLKT